MIRLAWRQMRWALIATAALLVLVATWMVLTRYHMISATADSGLSACLAAHNDCAELISAFLSENEAALNAAGALNFVPLLAGLLWAGPLISREVEQGTHRLVWTQSISPLRWFAVRVGILLLTAVAVAAVLTGLFTWWAQPLENLGADGYSRVNPTFYSLEGLVPAATMIFAFAIGVAASALIRRTVPAMAATLGLFLPPWLLLRELRAKLVPAQVLTYPFGSPNPRHGLGDWMIHPEGLVDRHGNPMQSQALQALCPPNPATAGSKFGGLSDPNCWVANGIQYEYVYQPLSKFWPLQAVESGILVTTAILLLIAAAWWTTRRIS